jgi:hypothetical protein
MRKAGVTQVSTLGEGPVRDARAQIDKHNDGMGVSAHDSAHAYD